MSLTASNNGFEKKQKPIPPQGPQVAICYSIIDLGTHMKSYQNQEPKATPLVQFSWELPNLPHQVFIEGTEPKPYAVFQEYTTSIGEKAKLPKMLSSWRGQPCNDLAKELPLFLGQPCYINIEHKQDKNNPNIKYANVAMNGLGVMRLPQGMQINPLTNPKVFFNLDNYSHEAFIALPKWMREKIKTSLEWSGIVARYGQPPEPQPETSSMQPNTNFTQQAPTQPQNNGFTTQVHVNSQGAQATFGGQALPNNPFDDANPPF